MDYFRCTLFLLTMFEMQSTKGQEVNLTSVRVTCNRGLPISEPTVRGYCCELQAHSFKTTWYSGGYYLSRHMELLKLWDCKEFDVECANRPYGFTDFTARIYDFFCNRTVLERKCLPTLKTSSSTLPLVEETNNVSDHTGNESLTTGQWRVIVGNLDFSSLPVSEVTKPCFQIAQLDSPKGGFGEFHEILSTTIPFCTVTWCGFSSPVVEEGIRPYDCLPTICKVNVIIMMIVVITLSILIVVLNIIVIAVFTTTKQLYNSQAIYKCSLAAADLLVGFVVLPTFAVNLYRMTWEDKTIGNMIQLQNHDMAKPFVDWDKAPMPGRDGFTIRASTGFSAELNDNSFRIAVGVLTAVSLMVSLYSLTMAGFDRLLAVYRPLRYKRHIAKKVSTYATIIIWIVAIVFSLLPVIVTKINYAISTMMYVVHGQGSQMFYLILFGLPLIAVWICNILIFIIVGKKRKERKRLTNRMNRSQERNRDNRLAITLTIVVGVFTLCCLPSIIISLNSLNILATNSDPTQDSVHNSIDFVTGIVMMSNSLWNYFIYSARNQDFRKASKALRIRIRTSLRRDESNNRTRKHQTSTSRVVANDDSNKIGSENSKKLRSPGAHLSAVGGNDKANNTNLPEETKTEEARGKSSLMQSLKNHLQKKKINQTGPTSSFDQSTPFDSRVATAGESSSAVISLDHKISVEENEL